ncbi:MAG: hypothetical protein WD276_02940 [Actinomycetota bacterium]
MWLEVTIRWILHMWRSWTRTPGCKKAAATLALNFSSRDKVGISERNLPLLKHGAGVRNVMWGSFDGMDIVAFDAWYVSESFAPYEMTCAIADVNARCPALVIETRVRRGRDSQKVDLPIVSDSELEKFNQEFVVRCGDRYFASAFVDQRMIEWLIEQPPGSHFEAADDRILIAFNLRKPDETRDVLLALRAFRDRIPRVILSLYPGAVPSSPGTGGLSPPRSPRS